MTVLDGKALSEKLLGELAPLFHERKRSLAVVVVGSDPAILAFINQKEKVAGRLGIDFRRYEYESTISTNDLRKRIAGIVHDADPDGIIIQLPLPAAINAQYILNAVPPEKDVDVLSSRSIGSFFVGKSPVFPPVAGAVKMLLESYGISYRERRITLVGAGRLVGKPIAAWLLNERATFSVVEEGADIGTFTRHADIVITGAGRPAIITADLVREGAVVIDAGTSESAGKIVGDVDFESVQTKASYLTPVPGGVGPLAVAMIFKNLTVLSQ